MQYSNSSRVKVGHRIEPFYVTTVVCLLSLWTLIPPKLSPKLKVSQTLSLIQPINDNISF